jgi:hypothetical protein
MSEKAKYSLSASKYGNTYYGTSGKISLNKDTSQEDLAKLFDEGFEGVNRIIIKAK